MRSLGRIRMLAIKSRRRSSGRGRTTQRLQVRHRSTAKLRVSRPSAREPTPTGQAPTPATPALSLSLRYRLLHCAGRLTVYARQAALRLPPLLAVGRRPSPPSSRAWRAPRTLTASAAPFTGNQPGPGVNPLDPSHASLPPNDIVKDLWISDAKSDAEQALASPGRQVPRRREARHVGAYLGQDAFRAAVLDADDGAQLNRWRERADLLLDGV
jgi:hypothetical protein